MQDAYPKFIFYEPRDWSWFFTTDAAYSLVLKLYGNDSAKHPRSLDHARLDRSDPDDFGLRRRASPGGENGPQGAEGDGHRPALHRPGLDAVARLRRLVQAVEPPRV